MQNFLLIYDFKNMNFRDMIHIQWLEQLCLRQEELSISEKYGMKNSIFFLIETFRVLKNAIEKFINFILLLFQVKVDERKLIHRKKNLVKIKHRLMITRQQDKLQVH